eukprot:7343348-Prymnesium_polylepis.1
MQSLHVANCGMALTTCAALALTTGALVWPRAMPGMQRHTGALAWPHAMPAMQRHTHRTQRRVDMGIIDDVTQAVGGIANTVEGVQAAYEDDNYVPEGYVRAQHILFLRDGDGEDARKAAALKEQIEAGGVSFDEAALRYSACPTRDLNGQLGIFRSLSRLGEGTLQGDSMPYDGQDTASFDALVQAPSTRLNVVHTVGSQWGTHLVLVSARGAEAAADPVGQAAEPVSQAMREEPAAARGANAGGFGEGSAGAKKKKARKKGR